MEFNKKKVTDFLSNNAIVILLVLLVLFVGFTRKGFFSGPNYSNIITNVTPRFIIALGVSGCLTVSYTHLDVYKRQSSKGTAGRLADSISGR